MPKDLLVVIPAAYVRGTLNLYLHQLEAAGIEFRIVPPPQEHNLRGCIDSTRNVATEFADYRALVCSDAFDVTFFGSKPEILSKIPDHGVLQAAEKNCWPEMMPISGSTPWKFANGGLRCGTPKSFLSWCDEVQAHPDYDPFMVDQTFFNRRLVESSPLCVLDSRTDVFFCLYKGYEELRFESGKPVNTLCGTRPSFIHANGTWETGSMWAKYLESIHAER
jgi:hypothetical protein